MKMAISKRKLVLIIADVILLAVCIVQCALKSSDSAKIFEFDETPDAITIVGEKGTVNLVKENDTWYVGDKKYPATESYVDDIIDSISSIRALDKVASASNESALIRYDLTEGKKITVTAMKDGKQLRCIEVGKEATATSQGYITVDGGKDIYLASGSLRYEFDKSVEELRSKVLWALNKDDITAVSIESDERTWSVSKMGNGDDVVWNVSGVEIDVDPAKAANWFQTVANISVPAWHAEGENLGGEKIITAKVTCGFKTTTLDIYQIPAVTDDGKPTYWGTSSDSPYTFELAAYAVQKFQKDPDELSK